MVKSYKRKMRGGSIGSWIRKAGRFLSRANRKARSSKSISKNLKKLSYVSSSYGGIVDTLSRGAKTLGYGKRRKALTRTGCYR